MIKKYKLHIIFYKYINILRIIIKILLLMPKY